MTVTVTDSRLHGSHPVSSTVKISDVVRVEMHAPDQIEIGSSTEAELAVYGMDDERFEPSQVAKMQLTWESLDTKRLTLTNSGEVNFKAQMNAVAPGNVYSHAIVQSVHGAPLQCVRQIV